MDSVNTDPIVRVVEVEVVVELDKQEIVGQKETRPRGVVLARGLGVLAASLPWPAPRPLPYSRSADRLEAVCLGMERDSSHPEAGLLLETQG